MNDPYERAVQIARDLLASPAEFVMPDPERMSERSLRGYLKHRGLNIEVRRRLAEKIRASGLPQNENLRDLAAAVLEGQELPARMGRPSKRWSPDHEITPEGLWWSTVRTAVRVIVGEGLLCRTRNRSSDASRSACDAVVAAAAELGHHIPYDQVEKVSRT